MKIVIKEKKCSVCLKIKPLEEFHRDKNRKDNRHPDCKKCKLEDETQRRKKYGHIIKKKLRNRYKKDKNYRELQLKKNKIWYTDNRKKVKAYRKGYLKKNGKEINRKTRERWKEDITYRNNKKLQRKTCREKYSEKHREKIRESARRKLRLKNENNSFRLKEKIRARIKSKKGATTLSDVYIISQIVKRTVLKTSDITQDLIKAKRLQLQIYRELKGAKV